MTDTPKEILTIEEACELLGVSTKTFAKILREEDLPGRKIGREWRFSRKALIDWVGSARARDYVETGRRKRRSKTAESGKAEKTPRPRPASYSHDKFSIEED
ncbi:MAG: helix-turn-helix domain-containing protein [Planctomycetota bacterium]